MFIVLKTENLCKAYHQELAVDHVNLNIPKGEIYGLVGPNGAGKTTIMRMIVGLAKPSQGSIALFGTDDLEAARKRIGSIIEIPTFYDNMTALQNLDMMLTLLPKNPRFDIAQVLEIAGLKNTGKKKVKHFSLGMRQRLGIAMALLGSPELLILDEPINGLDPIGIREIRELILQLNRDYGLTILISSHILSELFKLVTCYGIISQGKLVTELHQADIAAHSETAEMLEEYLITWMEGKQHG